MRIYDGEEGGESESQLDKSDSSQFGSYGELIKLDQFRYKEYHSLRNNSKREG
jgi:hypothetical protein